ncbi:ferredoxin--NADP reductase [Rhizosphaericola mali]|uniref:Ferredoxin--NADP reductase n=1 Tax=Rhizosphaericola mali TaxID=2545455 RepID=A0A5P2G083_9BACT|nr:ferredoxin--NADP reductase [Rhizosphaericola mali]QES89204.1 ferredoxin--NADP reductase [Rhizosphaericola mali]
MQDVVSIRLKQPGLKKVKYKPGQYLSVVVRINGRKYVRPYSLSSAPEVDSFLEITIKRVANGIVSNFLCDQVQLGDSIELIEPMGDFGLNNEPTDAPLIFWGGGSGITPLISIIKYELHKDPTHNIKLFYGNKSPKSTIFLSELNQLQAQFPSNFKVWYFYSQSIEDEISLPQRVKGRIEHERVIKSCEEHVTFKDALHFICGPQGIMDTVSQMLKKLGVDEKNIHLEAFKIQLDEKLLEGVEDQKVTFVQNDTEVIVDVPKGKNILDAGLDFGLDIDYACQQGSCLLCKAKLLNGDLKTIGAVAGVAELDEDERVLCCGYPLSENIKIKLP